MVSVSLCEKCRKNDWEHMSDIKAAYRESGKKEPEHIWCKETDRPEDMRWRSCPHGFEAMG